jgi:hypothetical protein
MDYGYIIWEMGTILVGILLNILRLMGKKYGWGRKVVEKRLGDETTLL